MALSKLFTRLIVSVGGVHASASGDPLSASRHASFITTHLVGGALAFACLAWYLAAASVVDAVIVAALIWLTAPFAFALLLLRTGRIQLAHLLSAAHHAILVAVVAAWTGGIASFVVPWIVVVPVEAALSGARRVIAASFAFALAVLGLLVALELGSMLPAARPIAFSEPALRFAGLVTAGLYACLLAIAVETLSRRSEKVARDNARDYRLMAENATDLISVHETNGRATFVSLGARRLFGADPANLLGAGFLDAVSVAERPAYLNAIAEAARNGDETSVTYRLGLAASSHEPVWVETRCRPLDDGGTGGSARAAVIAVTRDISEARAREDELRRARDAAESASRAKSRFLANVSHELRTPLNAIIGFSDILSGRLDNDANRQRDREFAGLIGESGTHLLNIVNDLLDMSRIEADRYEIVLKPVSVADIFRICSDLMGPAAQDAGVEIVVDAGDLAPGFRADERAVKQIVLNLLSNAVKFSDAGGTISLKARETADGVEITVTDQGIGIAAADLERLGEPFVQAEGDYDRKYEGAGLGLSVVKGLVRLHDGQLKIESAPGEGTCVTVMLPHHRSANPADISEQCDTPAAIAAAG